MTRQQLPSLSQSPLFGMIALMIGGAALFATAEPIHARAVEPVRTVAVSTAGVDLGTSAGQRVMQNRIHYAAQRACAVRETRDLKSLSAHKQCVNDAKSHSRMQLANMLAARPVYAAAIPSPSVTSPEKHALF
jgi:UrcA family protein